MYFKVKFNKFFKENMWYNAKTNKGEGWKTKKFFPILDVSSVPP